MSNPAGRAATWRQMTTLPRVRFLLRLLIGIAVSVACIIFVLGGVNLDEALAALGRANLLWLGPAIVALAVSIVAKALRWGLLYRPHYMPGWRPMTGGILVGQMINNALPVRLGEVARIQFLAETEDLPRTYSLGTVAVEKALDSVSLLALFVLVVPFTLLPAWVRQSGLLVTVVFGGALIGGILIVTRRDSLRSLADVLAERVPPLSRLTESRRVATILRSLDVLGHAGLLAQALGYSALALLAGALINASVLLAFGFATADLVPASLLILLLGYLGGAVPASPGRIGVFQAITMLSLAPFTDPATALSYSIVLYVVVIVVPTLAGVALLARHPFRLGATGGPDAGS